MARSGNAASAKRKRAAEDPAEYAPAPAVLLEAKTSGVAPGASDDEDGALPDIVDDESDDDEGSAADASGEEDEDELPEGTKEDEGEDEDEDEDEEDTPDEEEDGSESDLDDEDDFVHGAEDIRPFPVAKTIVSDITGRPKRVYPEIEPDYDSDSSTEDVRTPLCSPVRAHTRAAGPEPDRERPDALVRRYASHRVRH
jgi:hypothetical protein